MTPVKKAAMPRLNASQRFMRLKLLIPHGITLSAFPVQRLSERKKYTVRMSMAAPRMNGPRHPLPALTIPPPPT
jgi:hypothetical protein